MTLMEGSLPVGQLNSYHLFPIGCELFGRRSNNFHPRQQETMPASVMSG